MRVGNKISIRKWLLRKPAALANSDFSISVDFGCGANPRNPLSAKLVVGVDLSPSAPYELKEGLDYKPAKMDGSLPFPDDSIDVMTAFDVLEHIPRQSSLVSGNPFIEIMNEVHRVLKPGGILLAVTPCFPSPAAFQDPTHVNFITPETHRYFADDVWAKSLSYGFIGAFETISHGWFPWNGSWLVRNLSHREPKGFALFKSYVQRLFDILVFSIWPRSKSHYLWVLEKPNNS